MVGNFQHIQHTSFQFSTEKLLSLKKRAYSMVLKNQLITFLFIPYSGVVRNP